MLKLQDKVAVITGGVSGIGAEVKTTDIKRSFKYKRFQGQSLRNTKI